jgi:transposase
VPPRTLRERSVPGDLPRPAPIRVRNQKNRYLPLCDGYQRSPGEKRGSAGYDGYKKVNGNKLSALVDRNGLLLACTVAPVNIHDSRLYEPPLEAFEIPKVQERPIIISADAAYDAQEIRQYNRKRGIKSSIPVNRRSRKQLKRGRPVWFDPELYKKAQCSRAILQLD